MQRTLRQNSALHSYFSQLADTLNEAGLDQRKVLKPSVDIPWSVESVKNQLWRPIQQAYLSKKSTTELETSEIDKIYLILNRHLAEKFGISVEFPKEEPNQERRVDEI
jgi:hypothetical protein